MGAGGCPGPARLDVEAAFRLVDGLGARLWGAQVGHDRLDDLGQVVAQFLLAHPVARLFRAGKRHRLLCDGLGLGLDEISQFAVHVYCLPGRVGHATAYRSRFRRPGPDWPALRHAAYCGPTDDGPSGALPWTHSPPPWSRWPRARRSTNGCCACTPRWATTPWWPKPSSAMSRWTAADSGWN